LFLAVRVAIRSSSDLRRAYAGVAAVGLLLAAHFVYHVALGAWFALPRNVLAAVLLPPLFAGLALCFDERREVRWLAGRLPVAIVGLALLLTRSRAAWLGLALGGGVVLVPAIWREGR